MTLTAGVAATHQAIIGDRMRLALDAELAATVTGARAALAHPALVCDVAIGQSTIVTQRVKANLFYRGLRFHRYPVIGDTLSTRTEIVAMRENSAKRGRAPTGLAALRMTTSDQAGRAVLDFYRCAMLPRRDSNPTSSHADDLSAVGRDAGDAPDPVAQWDIDAYRTRVAPAGLGECAVGTELISTADVVSNAAELARLTLNIAATHHDRRIGGRRLVYGGHTIGLALSQATRLLPDLVTVLDWQSCDHTGPVFEGDTLYSTVFIENAAPRPGGRGDALSLRSLVFAVGIDDQPERQVLDWRFTALSF
ncbi:acyl dehydratase [Mycobacterium sp. 050134]|uniref:acyl dehydratase n=1 Tax=Mycobacterium sp. 050134 TaxID=3096111 RepID=UPI002ED7F1EC